MKFLQRGIVILCAWIIGLGAIRSVHAQQTYETVRILTNRITPNANSAVMQRIDALLGVHLDITGVSDNQYDEQLSVLLANGQSPDVFGINVGSGSTEKMRAAATITLDEIQTWMPDIWATIESRVQTVGISTESLLARWSVDGELKGFTTGRYNNSIPYGILIRTDVLRELGMEMPHTIADWDALLRAWKQKYPELYPLTCSNGEVTQAFYIFLAAYGVRRDEWLLTENGLEYAPFMPGMRAALVQLHAWYEANLIDPDYYLLYADSAAPNRLFAEGNTFFYQYYSLENALVPIAQYGKLIEQVLDQFPSATFDWAPFPTLGDGTKPVVATSDLFSGYIVCFGEHLAQDRDKLHRIMKIYNELHTNQELYWLQHMGIEGVNYDISDDGTPFIRTAFTTPAAQSEAGFGWTHNAFIDGNDEMRNSRMSPLYLKYIAQLIDDEDGLYSASRVTKINSPRVNGPLVSSEGIDYGKLNETWLKEWDAMFTAVIIGVKDISDFDSFIALWRNSLGNDMVALANERYLSQWQK